MILLGKTWCGGMESQTRQAVEDWHYRVQTQPALEKDRGVENVGEEVLEIREKIGRICWAFLGSHERGGKNGIS